jgi:hypothetical protein
MVTRDVTLNTGILEGSELTGQVTAGIKPEQMAKALSMLRNPYGSTLKAVFREYTTNALDAHAEVGKSDVPLEIHVPSTDDPYLRIRDFGPGLNQEKFASIFLSYCESTKESTNAQVGMFGIGSKAGFTYTDVFSVISWCDGIKTSYVMMNTPEGSSISTITGQEECGDETGIEVQIPIKKSDISDLHTYMAYIVPYIKTRPNFRGDYSGCYKISQSHRFVAEAELEVETPLLGGELGTCVVRYTSDCGISDYSGNRVTAIMGSVPYIIDLDMLNRNLLLYSNTTEGVAPVVELINSMVEEKRSRLEIEMPVGSVVPLPSRESLSYVKHTVDSLTTVLLRVQEEYLAFVTKAIETQPNWMAMLTRCGKYRNFIPEKISIDFHGWAVAISRGMYSKGTYTTDLWSMLDEPEDFDSEMRARGITGYFVCNTSRKSGYNRYAYTTKVSDYDKAPRNLFWRDFNEDATARNVLVLYNNELGDKKYGKRQRNKCLVSVQPYPHCSFQQTGLTINRPFDEVVAELSKFPEFYGIEFVNANDPKWELTEAEKTVIRNNGERSESEKASKIVKTKADLLDYIWGEEPKARKVMARVWGVSKYDKSALTPILIPVDSTYLKISTRYNPEIGPRHPETYDATSHGFSNYVALLNDLGYRPVVVSPTSKNPDTTDVLKLHELQETVAELVQEEYALYTLENRYGLQRGSFKKWLELVKLDKDDMPEELADVLPLLDKLHALQDAISEATAGGNGDSAEYRFATHLGNRQYLDGKGTFSGEYSCLNTWGWHTARTLLKYFSVPVWVIESHMPEDARWFVYEVMKEGWKTLDKPSVTGV